MAELSCNDCEFRRVCKTPVSCGDSAWCCGTYEHRIDRDELLALADEIMENANLSRELHDEMLNEKRLDMALTFHEYACELREYAHRIREVLGVSGDE